MFGMKILLTLFFLFFSSSVFADDISDFQIAGMSVGDSLLKYMSEEKILIEKEKSKNWYASLGDQIFFEAYIFDISKNFDYVSFFVKSNDTNFIIQAIYGVIYFKEDISKCYKKQNEIIAELDDLFKNTNKYSAEELMQQDLSGKSIMKRTSYKFTNQDIIAVECYDWDESMQKSDPPNPDILSLSINTKELFSWIN